MVFNATFNIFQLYLGGQLYWLRKPEYQGKTFYHIMLYRIYPAWAGFELETLVVMGTDCIGSCICNYHTITTTTGPAFESSWDGECSNIRRYVTHMSCGCRCRCETAALVFFSMVTKLKKINKSYVSIAGSKSKTYAIFFFKNSIFILDREN